jgi:hypothetical protein
MASEDTNKDRGRSATIGMIIVTILSTIAVLVRLYARGILIRELGWDDYLIVIGQVQALPFEYFSRTKLISVMQCSYSPGLTWHYPSWLFVTGLASIWRT